MDLRALRVAVAVAEHGSVNRAAGSLHQSSSAVSHTLLALETELGLDLFYRLPRGMALTQAGEVFVPAARRALHEAEVARRSIDAIRGMVTGRVGVSAVLGFSVALADLVGGFARSYPAVVVRVLPPESTDGVADQVRSGACEVGFTWAAAVPDDLDSVPVFLDPSVVVVPQGHKLAGRKTVRIEDLEGHEMVAPLASSTMRPVFDDLFLRQGVAPHVVAEAATNEMVLELVRAGVGCTITFASSAAAVTGRGAEALELIDHPANRFLLIMRARQDSTPAARAFRQMAIDRFGE